MTDWATISSLATAAGTLVLAVATFSAVRSSNRSARVAEQALQEQRRPVLVHARLDDPAQKIMFADGHWVRVEGSHAAVDERDGIVYLVLAVRNVGAGLAVLQAWYPWDRQVLGDIAHPPEEDFRRHTRDIYIAPGDIGLWQGAIRDANDPIRPGLADARAERRPVTVDLLYSDQVGGQRTISRFSLVPAGDGQWMGSVGRHWNLDHSGPR
ncbi:MAG TPA: hypothetical protein VG165_01970 [Solirubrobacteraceae bacterium]|jgi:hypothetical protein|nr:hypothetical protein [Solirubrobacteraceae bacterium]